MSKFETTIPTHGPDGNIFAVLGNATRMMKQLNVSQIEIDSLRAAVMDSDSYEQALNHIEIWFPIEREGESR